MVLLHCWWWRYRSRYVTADPVQFFIFDVDCSGVRALDAPTVHTCLHVIGRLVVMW